MKANCCVESSAPNVVLALALAAVLGVASLLVAPSALADGDSIALPPASPAPVVAPGALGAPGAPGAPATPPATPATPPAAPATPTSGVLETRPADAADELDEITVDAAGPRFVAPTQRDRIGRIWAPVFINGRGPFRLVLDTGASSSAVTALVAATLGIPTDAAPPVLLHGTTGFSTVPTIRVNTLSVGDLAVDSPVLPIVPDAMGGAQGVLGSEGLANKRIFIDFRHDRITITYSRDERSPNGFVRVPFHSLHGQLIVVDAVVGHVRTTAIIDTGGQTTIANLALRDALGRHVRPGKERHDEIIGATLAVADGEIIDTPAIELGSIQMLDPGVTFADLYIFRQWHLTTRPAILIGMDALGILDTLIIDYRRHELQMRAANSL